MSTLMHCCSDDLAVKNSPRYSPGLYAREGIAESRGNLTVIRSHKWLHDKKLALQGGLPYQADRVTLPLG